MGSMCSRLVGVTVMVSWASLALAQGPPPPLPPGGFGGPLPGISPTELAAFNDGRLAFTRAFTPQQGLGPVFNDNSCLPCHGGPAPGGGSARLVTRFGRSIGPGGADFDPMTSRGGSLIQARGIATPTCSVPGEVVPFEANVRTGRRSQPIFGLGLVDAVPDATFDALAATQRASTPATAGRVHRVTDLATGLLRVGRFGWKAQVGSLLDFSGDAMLNEIGLTNPSFPNESCPQGDCGRLACNPRPGRNDDGTVVRRMTSFQTFLAAPPRGPTTTQTIAGEAVFNRIGCNSCHVAQLVTGPNTSRALDRVPFRPYSDFLLHDMGPLGDGVVQGAATGREFRTAPLWGVAAQPRWLHDGRATTLEQAIELHDGQGAGARDQFRRLSLAERGNLIAFVRSL